MIKTKLIYGCEANGNADRAYMTRLTLFEKSWGQLCVHIFHDSDWSEDLHDHPWNFISLILWRGYNEETPESKKRKFPFMILFRKATHKHRVELIKGKTSISLVFMFPYSRQWGFWTKEGWMYWKNYFIMKGCK